MEKNKIYHRRIRYALPPAFAYEVIEKLLEREEGTDERTESESFALKKTYQIVKGASHTQYDPGMPDAIQKAMFEIGLGEKS